MVDLRGRHLMKLADFTPEEITYLLDLAAELKAAKKEGREEQKLVGKEIALIFEKDSTRTRCAFEVAAYDQGAHVTFIGPSGSHMGHKETVEGHGARPRPNVRRDRIPGLCAERGGGSRQVVGGARLQRPYRRMASDTDPRRLPDVPRAPAASRSEEVVFCYLGDARFNMADSLPRRRGEARDGRPHRQPEVALAPRRDRRARPLDRSRDGRADHDHRGRRRGGEGRRRAAHGRLGLDGRARRGLEGADRAAHALPGERRRRWR